MTIAEFAREEWTRFTQAASSSPKILFDQINDASKLILESSKFVLTIGAGKSSYPAGKLAASLRSIGFPAFYLSTGQILHGDLGAISENSVLIGISFSGETAEVVQAFSHAKSIGAQTISITGNASAPIAKISNVSINLNWISGGDYAGVIPTLSTAITNFTIDVLVACIARGSEFTLADFAKYHPGGYLGKILSTSVRDIMVEASSTPIFYQSTSVIECARLMSQLSKGLGVIVDQEGYLLGVISDGDIRRFIGSGKIDSIGGQTVSKIMCNKPAYIEADKSLAEAIQLMVANKPKRVSALPVIQNGKVYGMVSLVDIETFRSKNANDSN